MNALATVRNFATRRLDQMFPGFFPGAKHDHNRDFGFPADLNFTLLYGMYCRNSVAAAGVDKTALKTWQDEPFLLEKERDGSQGGNTKETPKEKEIRLAAKRLRLWSKLATADRMAMVGGYAGVILRLGDGQSFDKPVARVPGGLEGLKGVEPAWAGQITVAEWDTDPVSPTYGEPLWYQFDESKVGDSKAKRQLRIHPDRVVIWSEDGTLNCRSILEPGYNDLMTMEKVSGAGGEGFWKNAKSAPVLQASADAGNVISEMARTMGVEPQEVFDKMNAQVADWQKGFDQLLMLQGMEAKQLSVSLPSPEHFFGVALQSFAASISMPVKILVGMQTGERASQEDAAEWAQTVMSRRANVAHPAIMELVARLVRFGILPERDWFIDQADLTEASMAEKIDRAFKMADTNAKLQASGEWVFTPEEIRAAVGYEPLSEAEKMRDSTSEEDEDAATTPPANDDPAAE